MAPGGEDFNPIDDTSDMPPAFLVDRAVAASGKPQTRNVDRIDEVRPPSDGTASTQGGSGSRRMPRPERKSSGAIPAVVESDDAMVGSTIEGKYKILEAIGSGGMAVVYRAWHLMLEKEVALKLIHPRASENPRFCERFYREARLASELVHAHIVQTREFGQTVRGQFYMIMDLCPGRTLKELLEDDQPLEIGFAVRVVRQILDALTMAHTRAIIHRDVKPENIMVDGDGYTRILDFGLAKALAEESDDEEGSLTREGSILGTPKYMSPEQAAGTAADHRTDIYSTGMVLYEAIAGRGPFEALTAAEMVRKQIIEEPKLPSEIAPEREIPRDLEAAVMKALSKKVANRWESADAFKAALDAALEGDEKGDEEAVVLATPGLKQQETPQRTLSTAQRAGGVLALLVLVGLVATLAGSLLSGSDLGGVEVNTEPTATLELRGEGPLAAFRAGAASDATGFSLFKDLREGTYVVRITKPGFVPREMTLSIDENVTRTVTLTLARAPNATGAPPPVGSQSGSLSMLQSLTLQERLCTQMLTNVHLDLEKAKTEGAQLNEGLEQTIAELEIRLDALNKGIVALKPSSSAELTAAISNGLSLLTEDLEAAQATVETARAAHRALRKKLKKWRAWAQKRKKRVDAPGLPSAATAAIKVARAAIKRAEADEKSGNTKRALRYYTRAGREFKKAAEVVNELKSVRVVLSRLTEGARKRDRRMISAEFKDPSTLMELFDRVIRHGRSVQFEVSDPKFTKGGAVANVTTFKYIERNQWQSLTGYRVFLEKIAGQWKVLNVRQAK